MENMRIHKLKYLLLLFAVVISGCIDFDTMSTKEYNERYIDQDNKLRQEQVDREIKQSKERAPVSTNEAKPDYNWKPWEQQNSGPEVEQLKKIPVEPNNKGEK